MGLVAEEVVGAELVFRVEALFDEVVRPFCECGPVDFGVIGFAFHVGESGDEN